ncbi:methylation-associated defense system protein MAD4 [Acinetobacter nosocomialis]|uniref:methylation-associated defense system protein MAD4 n=1 Tax=Acinetobacter nosocomialis TaxID=106654 RepID=UPI0040384D24
MEGRSGFRNPICGRSVGITMRDIVFLVADGEMQATVEGFFENPAFDTRLQCSRFEFDTKQDLIKHPRKDPGVYQDGHNLLKSYIATHNYAVVMIDFAFNDNLRTMHYQQFCETIKANMRAAGWPDERFFVMAINPELEVLMWQADTRRIESVFDYPGASGSLRAWLQERNLWDAGELKPADPKAAIDAVRGQNWGRKKTHYQLFKRIAKDVSFRGCEDESFNSLLHQIQAWYPRVYA